MKWTAEHMDGFTERLLSYTLRYDHGVADLQASWFRPAPPTDGFRTLFELDDGPIVQAMPAILRMRERYDSSWDDLDIKLLVVDSGESVIQRHVYGGGELAIKQPELREFLDLFAWLEDQVLAHLPWKNPHG